MSRYAMSVSAAAICWVAVITAQVCVKHGIVGQHVADVISVWMGISHVLFSLEAVGEHKDKQEEELFTLETTEAGGAL